jgi:polysaccharide export outer membrane protein
MGHARARSLAAIAVAIVLATPGATLTLGCAATSTYDYRREPDPRTSEYVIGPYDELSIVVWKNQELSADVTVRPDGIVTLPLIGAIRAAGRAPSDLQRELDHRYADYVRAEASAISVAVTTVNSYQFTVSGNVEHAGVYNAKVYLTALDALAMAGGPNRFASDSFYIVRGMPARRIPIDLRRAISGEHPEENIAILRGDLIVVP